MVCNDNNVFAYNGHFLTFSIAIFADNVVSKLIQPNSLRAPEVILQAQWNTPVDIFNFGCLVRKHKLFKFKILSIYSDI
jgi:hypothetical protein